MAANDQYATIAPAVGSGDVGFLSQAWISSLLAASWSNGPHCGGTCSKVILFYIDTNTYHGGEIGPTAVWEQDAPGGPLQMRYCNYQWGS